jgi:hypothetical protein
MEVVKAVLIGTILDLVVSAVIHSGGSKGGFLYIQQFLIAGHDVSWSWPLFLAGTGLAGGIIWLMR